MFNVGNNRGNWRNSEVLRRPSNGRNDYRGNYENSHQGNQWLESRNRFQNDDRRFNDRGYPFRNGGQNDNFSRGDHRNKGSSENFSRGDRRQRGRLNVLKVITAQGAKCQNIGIVELNIRIREFEKPWLFHVLADLEYPCILGIDFTGGSNIILDFDRKSLEIPDLQIDKVVKTAEEEKVEIDLSNTKLDEKQRRELQDLFNSFQGLFSDKPGITHVLYHEIDTGDNPSVVSRPYRYDRVKQGILDYHVDKILKEGTIIPIQSPYVSSVVLCRKNNRRESSLCNNQGFAQDQLIEEQRADPELGHIYGYLENPEDSSIKATICIRDVKTVVYRPQACRTERVNHDLVQMIENYINEQHDTWGQFLREFAYAIRTLVNEATEIERLFEEARRNTKAKHEKWEKYYNRRRRDVQIKVNDWVLIATHPLSSATRKLVPKFKPKSEGPYRVLVVKNNNKVVWKAGKRLTINVDQVRIYRHRKCNEAELRTGSSDNGSLRYESSGFDRLQRRSNESLDGKKKGSIPSSWSEKSRRIKRSKNEIIGYKRSLESGSSGPERKIRKFRKSSDYRVPKTALPSNDSNVLQKCSRKRSKQDKVAVSTNRYNLRPRVGREVESRPAMEMKTRQGGPGRSRKGRVRKDNPYIDERTRSSNRNAKRKGDQQREEQKKKGASTRRSLSLEVLVGNANYKL
ncbi:uncharacterized protein TNCV_1947281 [Trichonephila clavipes]|nr:uncharacterized protein TNCV_1947281 [Trichonephila clavipes]